MDTSQCDANVEHHNWLDKGLVLGIDLQLVLLVRVANTEAEV